MMLDRWQRFETPAARDAVLVDAIRADMNVCKAPYWLALPGGSTPLAFAQRLATSTSDWADVHLLLTDERWVPQEDPASNAGALLPRLAPALKGGACWHAWWQSGLGLNEAAEHMAQLLDQHAPLDWVVLGMGADGHVASLFPGGGDVPVALSAMTGVAPDGRLRLGLSLEALARARHLTLLVQGQAKHDLLTATLAGAGSTLPVAELRARRGGLDIFWAVDTDQGGG